MNQLTPFKPVVGALRALLQSHGLTVGGSLPSTVTGTYVRLEGLPGRSDIHEGDFPVDVEVFSKAYSTSESVSFDIEAFLLGYSGMVEVPDKQPVRFDRITQNASPSRIPWDDDTVVRFLSTYVITVRR